MDESPAFNEDEVFEQRKQFFVEFLSHSNEYSRRIDKMKKAVQSGIMDKRLIVNIDDIRERRVEYFDGIRNSPMEYLPAFDAALNEIINPESSNRKLKSEEDFYHVGLDGSFGANEISPRSINAKFIGKLVCLEAIVTRCSIVRPKILRSVHYCEKTKMYHSRDYRDATMSGNSIPTSTVYPKEDENGNPLTTEYGYCLYRDFQTVSIQEMPERAPAGLLPRPLDVIFEDDLVDCVKPGDRVRLVGTYRSIGGKVSTAASGTFRTIILANNVKLIGKDILKSDFNNVDMKHIKEIGRRKNVFDLIARSLAPSIYGHEYVKKAILLLLLSGEEKNLQDGTHIRGDINMLMVGDPSTAKSQILRFVLNIAPLAIATTGRGSSGVGLTAAVTTDRETGERRLEAGAMVLADRGVVCIDEFDKMTDSDRVAIHEVMEQQTVTIAKAGIHTSLNARCSVVAAANPIYGRYDDRKRPFENIALPDSLLSRFDMLFIVLDDINETRDREIAEHVLRVHRFNNNNEDGTPVDDSNMTIFNNTDPNENEDQETPVWEKSTQYINTGRKQTRKNAILSIPFIKKYIQYAKLRIHPTLTQEAVDIISDAYVDLRSAPEGRDAQGNGSFYKTLPVTARTLETLIRLATAHAKARLSNTVQAKDAKVAKEMMRYVLWKDVKERERRKKRRRMNNNEADSDEESSEEEEDSEEEVPLSDIKSKVNSSNVEDQRMGETVSQFSEISISNPSEASSSQAISPERLDLFRRQLNILKSDGTDSFEISQLISQINGSIPVDQQFSQIEIQSALQIMSDNNQIFFSENVVYIV
ncbi:MCM-domain-containing protein [Neocallimastix lanati (nom. inval.)]|nr:MCM-domain-containing protein [Neocallimastix sp. JGI-2020a]